MPSIDDQGVIRHEAAGGALGELEELNRERKFSEVGSEDRRYGYESKKAVTCGLKVERSPSQQQTLPGSVSSIDDQGITRHEAAGIAQHEQRRAPVLFRRRQPSQHILPLPRLPQARILPEVLLHHRRHDVARAQAVDPDSLLPPLHRQVPAQLDNGRFR